MKSLGSVKSLEDCITLACNIDDVSLAFLSAGKTCHGVICKENKHGCQLAPSSAGSPYVFAKLNRGVLRTSVTNTGTYFNYLRIDFLVILISLASQEVYAFIRYGRFPVHLKRESNWIVIAFGMNNFLDHDLKRHNVYIKRQLKVNWA